MRVANFKEIIMGSVIGMLLIVAVIWWSWSMGKILDRIDKNGGMKTVIGRVWHGKT